MWSDASVSAVAALAQTRMRKAVRGPDDALKQTAGGAQVGGKGWEGAQSYPYVVFTIAGIRIWQLFMLLPRGEIMGMFLGGGLALMTQTALCASLVRAIGNQ